jgi:hypothetical protein
MKNKQSFINDKVLFYVEYPTQFDVPNCTSAFTEYVTTSIRFPRLLLVAHKLEDSQYATYCCGFDHTTRTVHTAVHKFKCL